MSSDPKIILVIRSSLDWFHGVSDYALHGAGKRQFNHALMGWKLFFKMGYLEFRQRLCEIAKFSYLPNKFDAIFYWADWETIKRYPEGTWILPIDEDDWVSPILTDVVLRVLQEHSDKKIIRWDIAHTSILGEKTYYNHWDTYPSCSYMAQEPFPSRFLAGHWNLIGRRHPWIPYHISQVLATKLQNLSSLSHLYRSIDSINSIIKVVKERKFLQKSEILTDFFPLVDRYNEVLKELYDSCRV